MPPRAGRRAVVLGLCFLQQGQLATTTRSTPTFNFSVADGGGFTMTIGNWTEDGRSVPPPAEATFSLQSQFSEPGVEKWTTLQPPWGGVPANFEVDRSEEEYGRTVVRVNASYDGLWILERVYQVAGHRVLVNDTLTARAGTVPSTSGGGGPSALAIYVQHILAAEAIGSVKDVVIPGSLGTYDCDNSNDDRGSFAAPQVWMATSSAAVAMMPLDDVFRVHSLATNAALAQYPRATTQRCTVSADERPTIVLADPHLGLAPGKQITLEWAIYPFGPEELDYLDFVNVLRHDLGTDEITIPHLGALGWARCTGNLTPCTVEGFESAGGFSNPHWEEWTPATAAAFFRQQGKLAITDNEDWLHGQCGEVDVDGTAFVSGAPPLFDEYLRNVTRLAKSAGGIPLVYLHTQISTGNAVCNSTVPPLGGAACEPLDDASTHSDSRVLDVNMSHVHYSHCAAGMDLPLFFPTTNNSYGEVMRQYIEKVFSLGAEGVFHDEFGQSSVSYTYGSSDGVSVIMDQNHSTVFEVAQIELLKGSLELELWGQITKHHGGWMIGNGAPTTRSWIEAMRGAARPSIHFAENSLHHRIGWVQAYTPLMLTRYQKLPASTDDDPKYAHIGKNVWLNVLAHLDAGVLTFEYDGMWRNSTTPTCTEQMVPITVTELGRGFVVGRERVVTKVNRTFTAPAGHSGSSIYIYEAGVLVREEQGGTAVKLVINGGPDTRSDRQMAIIVWKAAADDESGIAA